jgi:hypothetical protein
MNKKATFSKVVVLLISMAFIVSALGSMPASYINSESRMDDRISDDVPKSTGTRAGSPRVVLAELFTQWNCGPCTYANPALNELLDVYGPDQLVMIATHTWWPSPDDDPFYNANTPDADARIAYYSVTGVPTAVFDGTEMEVGGTTTQERYTTYKGIIESELMKTSPLEITITGSVAGPNANVDVNIRATDPIPAGTNKIKFVVTEDNRYGAGANGEVRHRTVMRDVLLSQDLPALTMGEEYDVSRAFSVNPTWTVQNLQIVVYVQNDVDKVVFNAAQYDFIPQEILVVDDDESVNPDGNEDSFHEVLSQSDIAFDGWVVNEAGGGPTSLDMGNYEVVIWLTASQSANTLTTSDQTELANYLDTTTGSLFITGENIGQDISASTFYSDYMYSSLVAPNNAFPDIRGIASDEISDPFAGSDLPIVTTSPSLISPVGAGTSTFVYAKLSNIGAVKAEHDMDSRIVYFAFMYFEGTDTEMSKVFVMNQVLAWLQFEPPSANLVQGYNLISVPNIQGDTTFDSVFDSISGEYDAVQCFDAADSNDPWKHWMGARPPGMNDLSAINHEMGFWIRVTNPSGATFIFNGTVPTFDESIDLVPGWNMVGYPSQMDRDRDSALNNVIFGPHVDAIWTYDAELGQWVSLGAGDNFEVGRGYLIHSLTTITWWVPL